MSNFFNLESPIWIVLNKVTDIIILSLIFIVTCLPVFTIGTSLCALYAMMFRLADNTEGNIIRGYFKEFGIYFKKATPVWLIVLIVAAFLSGDLYILIKQNMPASGFFLPATIVLSICLITFIIYYFALLAKCETDRKNLMILALTMPIKEILRTILMVFIVFIMIAVGVFVTAPFLAVAPGVIAFSHVFLFKDIFKKYNMQAVNNYDE